MPGLADPGQSGIAAPNPAALVQPMQNQITPDAVTAMSNAFRQGQISANDIIDRVGQLGQAKEKMQLQAAQEALSPEAIEARKQTAMAVAAKAQNEVKNATLEGVVQASKLKHENAVAKLGLKAKEIEAAYTSVGRLIPMKDDPEFPGAEVPDMDAIKADLPKITAYNAQKQQTAAIDAAWQPKKVTLEHADGSKDVVEGWYNPILRRESDSRPMPTMPSYDNWLQQQTPGTVTVTPKVAVAPPQPTASVEALGAKRAELFNKGVDMAEIMKMTPEQLVPAKPAVSVAPAKGSLAGTKYENWNVVERKDAPANDINTVVNSVATRYNSNKAVQDASAAATAYSAVKPVLSQITPEGNYAPGMEELPKQADYNLMVNYAKILDPTSVVREGEIALLKQTSSMFDRLVSGMTGKQVQDYINTVAGRQMFTAQERRSFSNLLTGAYKQRMEAVKPVREASADALRAVGATDVQIKEALPFYDMTAGGASTPGSSGAAAPAGQKFTVAGGGTVVRGPDNVLRLDKGTTKL